MEVFSNRILSEAASVFWGELEIGTYPSASTSDPTPLVESATERRNQVRRMLRVRRLNQMVIVVLLDLLVWNRNHVGGGWETTLDNLQTSAMRCRRGQLYETKWIASLLG